MRDDVLLAYEMNGAPLPPQHGYPLRLVVPGWYGMAHVKWLTRISAVADPFDGFQMRAYRLREQPDEDGVPVTRIEPRALLVPPGFPDFMSRTRVLRPGRTLIEGRAWSGWAPVSAVEVSVDGGTSWHAAELEPASDRCGWARWTWTWQATIGDYQLVRPRPRRERSQPAGRAAVEPRRVRQQPRPARPRRGDRMTVRGRASIVVAGGRGSVA